MKTTIFFLLLASCSICPLFAGAAQASLISVEHNVLGNFPAPCLKICEGSEEVCNLSCSKLLSSNTFYSRYCRRIWSVISKTQAMGYWFQYHSLQMNKLITSYSLKLGRVIPIGKNKIHKSGSGVYLAYLLISIFFAGLSFIRIGS